MIMMQAMATWRAWTAVAGPVKIIDCLLEPKLLGIACRAFGKHCQGGRDVIGCPVMPGAGRRVGIIAEKGKAAGTSRRIAYLTLPQSVQPVLGADLNCSESRRLVAAYESPWPRLHWPFGSPAA